MSTAIKELHAWLKKQNALPAKPKWKRTYMDITGITRLENRWSDIYRFFFDQEESHCLKDLFIRSLEKVAGIPENWIREFTLHREWSTPEKRIDLLITDKEQSRAIIIENKVYHTLNNDLEHYYKAVARDGYSNIEVIVLSLYKLPVSDSYKCVTHLELMNCVKGDLSAYFCDADPQYLFLLQDFIQNTINMTSEMNKDVLGFFIDNYDEVSQIHKIYDSVMNGYKKVFDNMSFESLPLVTKTVSKQYVYFKYKDCDQVSLTLLYDWKRLWKDPNRHYVTIVLELQGGVKDMMDRNNDEELRDISNKYSSNCNIRHELEAKKTWCHYASIDVEFSKEELLEPQVAVGKLYDTINNSPIYQLGNDIIKLYRIKKQNNK